LSEDRARDVYRALQTLARPVATTPFVLLFLFLPASHAAARSSGPRLDRSFGMAGWTRTPPGTGGEGRLVELSSSPDAGTVVADLDAGQIVRLHLG